MSFHRIQWFAAVAGVALARAQPFELPTANRALFEPGGEERFLVGTVDKPWTTGGFGCVRSDGQQMHEGLDIRCLRRDAHGEPGDAVLATADGAVAYFSAKPSLSNYGNYIILSHVIDGVEVYSLYGHLRSIREGLQIGQPVRAGETIATMGRTSNTRQAISRERAHVHFELNLRVNDRFASWRRKTSPDQRNDHGDWNGLNFLGIDPLQVLLEQRKLGTNFNLLKFIREQPVLCRVLVRDTDFPWLHHYARFVQSDPAVRQEGIAGYEIALNFNGVPLELIARSATQIKGRKRFQLLSVNEEEYRKHPCRRLVVKRAGRWELGYNGERLLDLLTYR
jgi:murein DD-endopeptidase MepM/ murein hydrolase activator NlpD